MAIEGVEVKLLHLTPTAQTTQSTVITPYHDQAGTSQRAAREIGVFVSKNTLRTERVKLIILLATSTATNNTADQTVALQ